MGVGGGGGGVRESGSPSEMVSQSLGEGEDMRTEGWPQVLGGDWEGASREVGTRGVPLSGDGCRQQGLTSQAGVLGPGHRQEPAIRMGPSFYLWHHWEGGASRRGGDGS